MSELRNNESEMLMEKLCSGDKKALSQIYNSYWKPLYISAFSILKNKEICEDIVQEVFLDIWKNRTKIKIKISLGSYLYACTRYKVYNHFRKNKNVIKEELFENLNIRVYQTTPMTILMHKELLIHIDSVVKSLPKKCKKVYKLSREKQLSHKEIGEKLNISTKTVENHITKALRIIRLSLGDSISAGLVIWLCQYFH